MIDLKKIMKAHKAYKDKSTPWQDPEVLELMKEAIRQALEEAVHRMESENWNNPINGENKKAIREIVN